MPPAMKGRASEVCPWQAARRNEFRIQASTDADVGSNPLPSEESIAPEAACAIPVIPCAARAPELVQTHAPSGTILISRSRSFSGVLTAETVFVDV